MKKNILRIAASVALVFCVALPGFAARGTADFTRFVAIGDSFGAGFESASLNQNHQIFSWPAVIVPTTATTRVPRLSRPLGSSSTVPAASIPRTGIPNGQTPLRMYVSA